MVYKQSRTYQQLLDDIEDQVIVSIVSTLEFSKTRTLSVVLIVIIRHYVPSGALPSPTVVAIDFFVDARSLPLIGTTGIEVLLEF